MDIRRSSIRGSTNETRPGGPSHLTHGQLQLFFGLFPIDTLEGTADLRLQVSLECESGNSLPEDHWSGTVPAKSLHLVLSQDPDQFFVEVIYFGCDFRGNAFFIHPSTLVDIIA